MGNLTEALKRNQRQFKIAGIFLLLPEDSNVDRAKLESMSTDELVDLYNDLTGEQVKRMASKAAAQKRVEAACREKGKWEETPETSEAGEPGEPVGEEAKAGKKPGKGKKAGKAAPAAAPEPKAKAGKTVTLAEAKAEAGKGKKAGKAAPEPKGKGKAAPAPKAKKDAGEKAGRGAPTKNPTYELVPANSKTRNPKGLRVNESSARMVVLRWLESQKSNKTKEQIEKHFEGTDTNVGSSLYFLNKHTFIKIVG